MKAVGKRFEIICFSKKWSKKKPVNALVYRLCGGELGIRTLGSLWEHGISRFYSNPPKTGSFRPFKTIVEKFVNAKIMLFSLFLPVGKNSGKNKIRRILI